MPFAPSALRLATLMSLACGIAQAAGDTAALRGRAVIAGKDRPVAIRLDCSDTVARDRTGALSVEMAVKGFEALGTAFDFGAFEGPEGTRKPLSDLTATGPGGTATLRSAASGSIAVEPSDTFNLGISVAMRGEAKRLDALRSVAGILASGPSELAWVQASPRKGDAPFTATAAVSEADSARIKAAVAPCLAER